jgi:hypothetical protein
LVPKLICVLQKPGQQSHSKIKVIGCREVTELRGAGGENEESIL